MPRCTNPPPVDVTWPLSIIVRSDVTIEQKFFFWKKFPENPLIENFQGVAFHSWQLMTVKCGILRNVQIFYPGILVKLPWTDRSRQWLYLGLLRCVMQPIRSQCNDSLYYVSRGRMYRTWDGLQADRAGSIVNEEICCWTYKCCRGI